GYTSKEQVIGNSIGSFFNYPADAVPVLEALASHDAWEGEFLAKRADGTTFISRGIATSLRNTRGELIGYQSTSLDVTKERDTEKALRESELDLDKRNNFINTILENLTFGVAVTTIDSGVTKYINPAYSRVYGWPAEDMKDVESFFKLIYPDPVYSAQQMKIVMEDINSGDPERMHWVGFMITTKTGEERFIEARNIPLPDQNLMISTAWDITDRIQAEEALQKNYKRLELAMQTANMAWWEMDIVSGNVTFNPRKAEMLGYTPEKFKHYKDFMTLVHPEDYEKAMDAMRKHISGLAGSYEVEYRILTKSGEYKWFYDIGSIVQNDLDGTAKKVTGLVLDISNRKMAEDKLTEMHVQLQLAYSRQSELVEDTKKAISREIHDELGQSLSALMINLDWIQSSIQEPEIIERIDEMASILNDTIISVQKISSDLRPELLDDLGLTAAMEFYIQEFEKRTGIKCHFKTDDIQYPDEKINIVIYRLLQESLTNIIRHAKSENAYINVFQSVDLLTLEVVDDGTGFDLKKLNSRESLGFIGMRERIKQFNGTMEISSARNEGTRLTFKFPFNSKIIR
ncbi:MAG: PAS domain S-box protein, partial [Bacteroidales bacterium]|nr:PAS domain S-box protein [Bacteroidales bacterium]